MTFISPPLSLFQGAPGFPLLSPSKTYRSGHGTGQTRNLLVLSGSWGSNPTVSAIEGSLAKLGFVRLFHCLGEKNVVRQLMSSPVSIASAEDIFD